MEFRYLFFVTEPKGQGMGLGGGGVPLSTCFKLWTKLFRAILLIVEVGNLLELR